MAVVEIPDFVKGKKTRRGERLPVKEELVTAVTPDDIDAFINARSERERRSHLRGLRDLGTLIHNPGRLTQRVRTDINAADGRFVNRRAYVFRGSWHAVPKIHRRRQVRVFT